jgi:hypothetical protein
MINVFVGGLEMKHEVEHKEFWAELFTYISVTVTTNAATFMVHFCMEVRFTV